jgi:hypothetical protein
VRWKQARLAAIDASLLDAEPERRAELQDAGRVARAQLCSLLFEAAVVKAREIRLAQHESPDDEGCKRAVAELDLERYSLTLARLRAEERDELELCLRQELPHGDRAALRRQLAAATNERGEAALTTAALKLRRLPAAQGADAERTAREVSEVILAAVLWQAARVSQLGTGGGGDAAQDALRSLRARQGSLTWQGVVCQIGDMKRLKRELAASRAKLGSVRERSEGEDLRRQGLALRQSTWDLEALMREACAAKKGEVADAAALLAFDAGLSAISTPTLTSTRRPDRRRGPHD